MTTVDTPATEAQRAAMTAFARSDAACVFGPSFFFGQLGQFVRDRCPSAEEHLPLVEIHLTDGETIAVCHIVGIAPRWVMVAVWEKGGHHDDMAISLIPYEIIQRVHIRTRRETDVATIGFQQAHSPTILDLPTLLQAILPRPHPADQTDEPN